MYVVLCLSCAHVFLSLIVAWSDLRKMRCNLYNGFYDILGYFCFDNTIYKQTFGTPMGSPLSPTIADIVLQDIENKALYKIGTKLPIYYRYVDDILLAVPKNSIQFIVDTFNSYH